MDESVQHNLAPEPEFKQSIAKPPKVKILPVFDMKQKDAHWRKLEAYEKYCGGRNRAFKARIFDQLMFDYQLKPDGTPKLTVHRHGSHWWAHSIDQWAADCHMSYDAARRAIRGLADDKIIEVRAMKSRASAGDKVLHIRWLGADGAAALNGYPVLNENGFYLASTPDENSFYLASAPDHEMASAPDHEMASAPDVCIKGFEVGGKEKGPTGLASPSPETHVQGKPSKASGQGEKQKPKGWQPPLPAIKTCPDDLRERASALIPHILCWRDDQANGIDTGTLEQRLSHLKWFEPNMLDVALDLMADEQPAQAQESAPVPSAPVAACADTPEPPQTPVEPVLEMQPACGALLPADEFDEDAPLTEAQKLANLAAWLPAAMAAKNVEDAAAAAKKAKRHLTAAVTMPHKAAMYPTKKAAGG